MGDIDICLAEEREGGTPKGASELKALLADIVSFRDECWVAARDLMPVADPTGDARLVYRVIAEQLTVLIKRHGD